MLIFLPIAQKTANYLALQFLNYLVPACAECRLRRPSPWLQLSASGPLWAFGAREATSSPVQKKFPDLEVQFCLGKELYWRRAYKRF